ncbi:hypothetical protein K439DRAFT_935383 [Ramaria rubella]|nr:hypothetical protein K439DRAFT_935383 [Ramaria rubella]
MTPIPDSYLVDSAVQVGDNENVLGTPSDDVKKLMHAHMQTIMDIKDHTGRPLARSFMWLSSEYAQPLRNDIIKRLMWFDLIFKRIEGGKYRSLEAFASDIDLILSNALVVYERDSPIWQDAIVLKRHSDPSSILDLQSNSASTATQNGMLPIPIPEDTIQNNLGVRRRALLITITYEGQVSEQGEPFELQSSRKNLSLITDFLHTRNYQDSEIVVLADDGCHKEPTYTNLIEGFTNLVKGAKSGDSFFIYYSGHGTQVKNLNGTELDGFDEVILPLDWGFNREAVPFTRERYRDYIIDDALNEILVKDLPLGARLVALFDCCHAGTLLDLRWNRGPPKKFTVEPLCDEPESDMCESEGIMEDHPKRSTSGGPLNLRHLHMARHTRRKGTLIFSGESKDPESEQDPPPKAQVISWCSSSDGQTSWQHTLAGGIMTQAFVKILSSKPEQSYQDLLVSFAKYLEDECHEIERKNPGGGPIHQEPQLGFNNRPDMKELFWV